MPSGPAALRLAKTFIGLIAVMHALPPALARAQRAPRFERTECPFQAPRWTRGLHPECGYLTVPQVRSKPNGRTLRLTVAVYRATERATAPPLLLLHGGPGGGGGIRTPWPFFQSPLVRNRDLVIFDLRGAGLSQPQLCPGFYENTGPVFNRAKREDREQAYNEAVRACVASLKQQGIDPSAYSTEANALDAIDMRHALGYARWDIYGVSYGGRLALELMRRDRVATHAVVLASPGAPTMHEAQSTFTMQRALERLFAACAAEPNCRGAFPTLQSDFYALYDDLSSQPIVVALETSRGAVTVQLDGERYVRHMWEQLSNSDGLRWLPLIIHELRRGDRTWAARRLLGDGIIEPWYPLGHLVSCNDDSANYAADVSALKPKLPPAFQAVADDLRAHCDGWVARPKRAASQFPSTDTPTLILTGEFDPRGIDLHMREMAGALKRAYMYDLHGLGHMGVSGGCLLSVVEHFLEDPSRAPDAACFDSLQPVAFATRKEERPGLVFAITAAAGTQTPFAGEWSAPVQAAPTGVMRIELVVDGTSVTGAIKRESGNSEPVRINSEPVWIYEGKIQDESISFKVKSPDGLRVITFTGVLSGDGIGFRRDVEEQEPRGRPRPGIFGTAGPRTFTATRTASKVAQDK